MTTTFALLAGPVSTIPSAHAATEKSDRVISEIGSTSAADVQQLAGAASSGIAERLISPDDAADRLVLLGDSLAQEVAPILHYLTAGMRLVPKYWGGSAPCDWLDDDLEANRSSVVVITFTGNTLTPCMQGADGAQLVDEALIERYRDDAKVLVGRARAAGAWVVLIGQPARAASFDADVEVNGINEMYRQIAAATPYVSFVDAGGAVETPDGRFTERLPCTSFDTDCATDGTTVVRGDGVHFCPIAGQNPCTIWASGAFRFALGIADAANHPALFDEALLD